MSTFKITGTITNADGSKVDFTAIDTPDYNKVIAMSGMGSVGALSTNFAPGSSPPLSPPIAPVITRNVFLQPFDVHSIWNQPIGQGTGSFISGGAGAHGGATFKYANNDGPLYEKAPDPAITGVRPEENPFLFGPASASKQVFTNTVGWSGSGPSGRCAATQTATGTFVPVPANASFPGSVAPWASPCSNAGITGSQPNASAAILLSDRASIRQIQPMQICTVGGSPNYLVGANFEDYGAGLYVNIFADELNTPPSAYGSHGGSGMSGLGGAIRYNQLIPGNCPIVPGVADVIRHALSFEFNGGIFSAFTGTHVWPAITNDAGNEGLLLALLPTFNINSLTTAAGRSIAWTLINYGCYQTDNGFDSGLAIDTEYSYGDSSVNCPTGRTACQFNTVWTGANYANGFADLTNGTAWGLDIKTICANLYVITNNSPSNIGGPSGATRLQPLANHPVDQGVISSSPFVTDTTFQTFSHAGLVAGTFIGNMPGSDSPYNWTLSGPGFTNFWIQPTTGFVYISQTGASAITAGIYTLTATATNIVGSGSGTLIINVN